MRLIEALQNLFMKSTLIVFVKKTVFRTSVPTNFVVHFSNFVFSPSIILRYLSYLIIKCGLSSPLITYWKEYY